MGSGALRAWLPKGAIMVEIHVCASGALLSLSDMQFQDHLSVYNPIMRETSTYRTYDPVLAALEAELPHAGLYGSGVWDIILTAGVRCGQSKTVGKGVDQFHASRRRRISARRGVVIGTLDVCGTGMDWSFSHSRKCVCLS